MRSLRKVARCIGVRHDFHVVRDFFGYLTGAPGTISLRKQIRRVRNYHVHINVIQVGEDSFEWSDKEEIDAAVAFMRDTYATVGFGVGRIEWYRISLDEANGHAFIADDNEAEDLTHEWTVDNDGIDVFFVLTYAGSTIGYAPRKGGSNKDANGRMTGVVLAIESSTANTGLVLAREVGRYLGLKDSDNHNNLMFPTVPNGGNLTHEQGDDLIGPGRYIGPFVNLPCDTDFVVRWA